MHSRGGDWRWRQIAVLRTHSSLHANSGTTSGGDVISCIWPLFGDVIAHPCLLLATPGVSMLEPGGGRKRELPDHSE